MTRPFVSVVTVNYNGKSFIEECLEALGRQTYPRDRYEIIVVDNASQDGSAELAASRFPDVRLVKSRRNVGFAAGNNLGFAAARGELLALINNDAFAEPGWIEALVTALEEDPRAGLVTSRILFRRRTLEIELGSGTFWPRDVLGTSDTRQLGIKLLQVSLNGLKDAQVTYGEGFYPEESGDTPTRYRWTDGCASLRINFSGEVPHLPVALLVDGWRPEQVEPARLVVSAEGVVRHEQVLPRGPVSLTLPLDREAVRRVPRRLQNVGLVAFQDWFAGDRGSGEVDDGRYGEREEVFGACGAAMMVRRAVIEDCGPFDPSFFMYYEDVDLALRARSRGHTCLYVPDAVVEHLHAGSSVEGSSFFTYNVERNRLAVMVKHAPMPVATHHLRKYAGEALHLAGREIRRGVFRGGPGSAGGTARLKMKVLASLARRMPALLYERARIAARRKVTPAEIARWLVPRSGPGSRIRVGIYDLHLRTLGGGEKYLAEVADILSETYDVDLIAYRPPSREVIERRLNVDLSKVRVLSLPGDRELDLRPISSRYDLFINGTHDSELEAYSRKSILVCHFPKKREIKPLGSIAYDFLFGSGVEFHQGFYDPETIDGARQRWSDGNGVLRIRNVVGRDGLIVDLRIIEYRLTGVDVRFALEGRPLAPYEINILPEGVTQYKVRVEPGSVEPGRQYFYFTVVSSVFNPADAGAADTRNLGVIVQEVKLLRPGGVPAGFGRWRAGYLAGGMLDDVSHRFPHLETYDAILTHSRYSAGWIRHYWSREARLLYPAIEGLEPGDKKPVILSVGRFFEGHHNKKHLLMVLAFKSLVDEGLTGWEFHLVGGTHEEEHHRRYLDRVRREAAGYPIRIHTNIPHDELARHYAEARIFWHASGHEEDERRHPERFEHFGISTVEAMLAGAVPVVIGKAGQLETVANGVDGFLWSDVQTLRARTRQLAEDTELWERMSQEAVKKARCFSREAFKGQLSTLIAELLS